MASSVDRGREAKGNDLSAAMNHPLIGFYLKLGRLAAEAGEVEQACKAYRRALQCCHLADLASGGGYRPQQKHVNEEYASMLLGRSPVRRSLKARQPHQG